MIEAASRLTAQVYDLDYAICHSIGAIALQVRCEHKKHKPQRSYGKIMCMKSRNSYLRDGPDLPSEIISHHDMQSHRIFIQGNDVHNCPDLQSKNISRTEFVGFGFQLTKLSQL
jgi:hypothetical protein